MVWSDNILKLARQLNQVAIQCGTMVSFELLQDWLLVRVQRGADIWVPRKIDNVGSIECVVAQRKFEFWNAWSKVAVRDLRILVRTSLAHGVAR